MKMSLKAALLFSAATLMSSVKTESINYITRFLYDPVASWGDNIVMGK
tara:strand:+ start:77 stop:220 length:144 start_codon:yes stop_codon:yes gene_type:complete